MWATNGFPRKIIFMVGFPHCERFTSPVTGSLARFSLMLDWTHPGKLGQTGQIFSGSKNVSQALRRKYAWALTEQPAPGSDLMIKNMPPISWWDASRPHSRKDHRASSLRGPTCARHTHRFLAASIPKTWQPLSCDIRFHGVTWCDTRSK